MSAKCGQFKNFEKINLFRFAYTYAEMTHASLCTRNNFSL